MSSILNELDDCAEYRGVSICILGTIDNWVEVAKENYLIAESAVELLAWWTYHKKPLEVFKGDYLILYNEPV